MLELFMALLLLVAPLLMFLLFLNHFVFGTRKKVLLLPPGPNQFHVLGYLWQLIYKPHVALQTLSNIYGPLASLQLGNQLLVVASSPESAKEICRTHDRVFSGRHLPAVYQKLPGSLESSILMSQCGDAWKLLRSIGQSSVFSSRAMEATVSIRKDKVMDLVDHLRAKEGRVVDMDDMMFGTLSNIISGALVSRNLFEFGGQDKTDDYKAMADLIHRVIEKMITFSLVDFLPVLKVIDFWSNAGAKKLYKEINLIWGGIVRERRSMRHQRHDISSSSASDKDFLDIVLADTEFSDDQISNALMELLIAATDSTLITTIWTMVELIRNKEKLSKVREELSMAVEADGSSLSETLVSECCSYFQACIKETLRLHVPAPLLVPHRATEACTVNDYMIPKDSMVVVNSWAIARDPKYWEDATCFKPERFLDSKIGYKGTHYEYLPFGTGVRMCPGSSVAFKNVEMVVGSLLHYFEWTIPDGSDPKDIDMNDKYFTTLKKEKPLHLVPHFRGHKIA